MKASDLSRKMRSIYRSIWVLHQPSPMLLLLWILDFSVLEVLCFGKLMSFEFLLRSVPIEPVLPSLLLQCVIPLREIKQTLLPQPYPILRASLWLPECASRIPKAHRLIIDDLLALDSQVIPTLDLGRRGRDCWPCSYWGYSWSLLWLVRDQ